MNFADRLYKRVDKTSCLVVGIDPNFDLMPDFLLPADNTGEGVKQALIRFSSKVIDVSSDLICAVKFQSSYFEQFGVAGLEALAKSISYARGKGLLIILDVKRGDIGSTSQAYANGYLAGKVILRSGAEYRSDLEADCMTVNPFLGEDSILPFIETAKKYGKGIFILVKTSNPDSKTIMDSKTGGVTVSETLARLVNAHGQDSIGESGFSSIGAVVGATYPEEAAVMRRLMPRSIFLAPGIGSQGGTMETVKACFDENGRGAIIPISRAITYPSKDDLKDAGYDDSVRNNAAKYAEMAKSLQLE